MRSALIVGLLLLGELAGVASVGAEDHPWKLRGAYLAAGAADLATTEMALASGSAHEGNPLLQNRAVRILGVLGMAMAVAELDLSLGRKGKTSARRICRTAFFTVSAAKVGLALRFTF